MSHVDREKKERSTSESSHTHKNDSKTDSQQTSVAEQLLITQLLKSIGKKHHKSSSRKKIEEKEKQKYHKHHNKHRRSEKESDSDDESSQSSLNTKKKVKRKRSYHEHDYKHKHQKQHKSRSESNSSSTSSQQSSDSKEIIKNKKNKRKRAKLADLEQQQTDQKEKQAQNPSKQNISQEIIAQSVEKSKNEQNNKITAPIQVQPQPQNELPLHTYESPLSLDIGSISDRAREHVANRYTQMGVRKAIGTKYNRERAQNPVKNSARLPWAAREKGGSDKFCWN